MARTNENTKASTAKSAASDPANHDDHDDSLTDLLVDTIDTSVRTSINLMKVPVVMYAGMVDCWAKAVDSMLRDLRPDPDEPKG